MSHRFYVDSPIQTAQVTISGGEAHHLKHVFRAQVNDCVNLFDGSGQEFAARITAINRDRITLLVLEANRVDRERASPLVVGTALPKGDRQRWLIEKMVELGATSVVPLRTARSVVHPDRRVSDKLSRTVIEASKQCGRNHLMQVAAIQSLDDFIQSVPDQANCWLADPSGVPFAAPAAEQKPTGQKPTYLAVGPEGGFTADELAGASAAGWQIVSLGCRILRIETACFVLATRTA